MIPTHRDTLRCPVLIIIALATQACQGPMFLPSFSSLDARLSHGFQRLSTACHKIVSPVQYRTTTESMERLAVVSRPRRLVNVCSFQVQVRLQVSTFGVQTHGWASPPKADGAAAVNARPGAVSGVHTMISGSNGRPTFARRGNYVTGTCSILQRMFHTTGGFHSRCICSPSCCVFLCSLPPLNCLPPVFPPVLSTQHFRFRFLIIDHALQTPLRRTGGGVSSCARPVLRGHRRSGPHGAPWLGLRSGATGRR